MRQQSRIKKTAVFFLIFLLLPVLLLCCGGESVEQTTVMPKVVSIKTPTGYTMSLIPSGSFLMGSDQHAEDESPIHTVTVNAFAMDVYEVTQERFENLMMEDPSHFKDKNRPVEQVRWSDAAEFCNARSVEEGLDPCYDEVTYKCNFEANGYRLPTEAEWEYACRSGSASDYCFGSQPSALAQYAWFKQSAQKQTKKVGLKKPNAWGLYDMHGNVMEWCYDVYGEGFYTESPESNPKGPAEGKKRVLRGGAWNSSADACRASFRMADVPGITDACFAQDTYGFRCVRNLSTEERALLDG